MAHDEKDLQEATQRFLENMGVTDDTKPHPLLHRIQKLGLRQNALAENFGVPNPTLHTWLHGKAPMPSGVEDELNMLCLKLEKERR